MKLWMMLVAILFSSVSMVSEASQLEPAYSEELVDGSVYAFGDVSLRYDSRRIYVTLDQVIRVRGNASIAIYGSPRVQVIGSTGRDNIKVNCFYGNPILDVTTLEGKDRIDLSMFQCGGFVHLDVDDDVNNRGGQFVTALLHYCTTQGEIYVTNQDPEANIRRKASPWANISFNRYNP